VAPPDARARAGELSDDKVSVYLSSSTYKVHNDDDDDDSGGDYLFEHISSMKNVSKGGGGGKDTTSTKSSAVMSTDIDSLATFVAQAAKSTKKSSETTASAPSMLYRPPPDIERYADLVASIARKHQKKMMASYNTKLATSKVVNERRGHNTLMQVTCKKLGPVPWNGGMWPMSGISVPGRHDCLIGRGGK
jgi:hypothetical protein